MSVQVIYSSGAETLPDRCQILINGVPLFKDRRFVKKTPTPITPEGILFSPERVLQLLLKATQKLCEKGRSEIKFESVSIGVSFILHDDQKIQIKVNVDPKSKSLTIIKEDWTDLPALTIEIFSSTDKCLKENWGGWHGSAAYTELKDERTRAERVYWDYLEKRRGSFDVADDRRPTQGAGPRNIDIPEDPTP